MTREELFKQHYPGGEDYAPLFNQEYTVLKNLWETTPKEYRDSIPGLPVTMPSDIPAGARAVEQRYRYRLASEFVSDMPLIFRRVLMLADDIESLDLLFFGTMGALSACLPNVSGSLMREVVRPNLYIFVTGAAASGKGKINLCRKLIEPINTLYTDSLFTLPADSTATAIYEEIDSNGGRGILFENELDTLSHSLMRPYGQFSDGLRRAFHNETISYMRRTNHERVVIEHPEISMVLTGTPGQVPAMFKDVENGLYSRILFYRLMTEKESFVEDAAVHRGITGQMVDEYMHTLGMQLRNFYVRLQDKEQGVQFRLTDEQHQIFMSHFHDATLQYKELFRKGYDSDKAADNADGIMKRLGNICYRMMMVLSVTRLMEQIEQEPEFVLPDEVVCDPCDFERVMDMEPMLRFHNHLQYDELMVANGTVLPMPLEDGNEGDMLKPAQRLFFQALPDRFITQQALQVAVKMTISEKTARRYLIRFIELGLVIKKSRGSYEKSSRGEVTEASLTKE